MPPCGARAPRKSRTSPMPPEGNGSGNGSVPGGSARVREVLAFGQFAQRWAEHLEHAQSLASLARSGEGEAAASLFDGPARAGFRRANDELRRLIDLTETKAEAARNKTADAISAAQRWISDLMFGILALFVGIVD